MNKFYTTYIFIFIVSSISAQSLRQHSVDSLDSLNKIAQKYGVLVEDIIELNPNSSEKLTPGDNLIIPNPIHKKSVNKVKSQFHIKFTKVERTKPYVFQKSMAYQSMILSKIINSYMTIQLNIKRNYTCKIQDQAF